MITPNEIKQKEFTKTVRGYSEEEVNAYLDDIRDTIIALADENRLLKGQIISLKESYKTLAENYKTLEGSLCVTLESAKSLMSQISSAADKRASILLENAKIDAEKIVSEAQNRVVMLETTEKFLKDKVVSLKSRFKYMLENEIRNIDAIDLEVLDESVLDEFEEVLNEFNDIQPSDDMDIEAELDSFLDE